MGLGGVRHLITPNILQHDGSWFYTGRDDSQSVEWALHNLVDTVSRGGNLLLNMGPTPEGRLPPKSVRKLKPLGAWLGKYAEAIYGVEEGPHHLLDWGACTRRGNTLYYHVRDWPADSKLVIPGLNEGRANAGIQQISILGEADGATVHFQKSGRDLVVSLPDKPLDPLMSVLKVEFDGEALVNNAIRPLGRKLRPQQGNAAVDAGDYFLSAAFARIYGHTLHFSLGTGAGAQRENLKGWTDPSDWEILADKPGVYELKVSYSSGMESGSFAVEIDGRRFEHAVAASKHKGKRSPLVAAFKTVSLGQIRLEKPGSYKLAVKAVEIAPKAIEYHQGLMLLREVMLKKQ